MTDFEGKFDELAEEARVRFERDGSHDHLIYMLSPLEGKVKTQEIPFGALIHNMPGGDIHSRKERAYRAVASMMAKYNCPGYVEVSETWITALKGNNEEVLRQYNRLIDRYSSIKNVPGREEWLRLCGRYGREVRSRCWKIGRRADQVWLEHAPDGLEYGKVPSKAAILDETALKLIENR